MVAWRKMLVRLLAMLEVLLPCLLLLEVWESLSCLVEEPQDLTLGQLLGQLSCQ